MYNPLGAGVRWAVHVGGVGLGSTVLILGAGQRGLSAVIAAKAVGAETVIVTGLARDHVKLDLAREFGADHTINVEEEDTVARTVKELLALPPIAEVVVIADGCSDRTASEAVGAGARVLVTPTRLGKGRALDNIFTERLWRTVKYEEVYLRDYATPRDARTGLGAYFAFYNERRLHQALGYRPPASSSSVASLSEAGRGSPSGSREPGSVTPATEETTLVKKG